jgi:5-methylphenazine-1-carboxylate 1-monooxygenase
MKVIIIGGGIGGLCTALCLKKAGFEVKIFESVKEIRPLGVGINTLPHCVRVLTNLGLQEKIAKTAVETKDLLYFNRFGQKFWEEPRGRFAGYKWPQFSIHRGNFQMLLFEEVIQTIGAENVLTNHHLQAFQEINDEVIATFINRETGEVIHQEKGDILIGADGINSVVRKQLYPTEGEPCYSDNVLYRGTTWMKPFLSGSSMVMIGSLKQKMVTYPIDPKLNDKGEQLINWVANLKETDSEKITVRDWNRQADKARLVEIYKNWNFDWLDVPKMIDDAPAVYEFPMSDRNPLDRWTFGRVTLLGDAAHPMYPIGSNGASQAILDADCLTEMLVNEPNILKALQNYDAERVPAAAKVVMQNRAKGPDQIMDMIEERFPEGFTEEEIPYDELETIMTHYKQIAGFDVQSLNQKL